MTDPTNEELAEALRSIEGLPLGTRLIVRLAADRLCDRDGWITWNGGDRPVPLGTRVETQWSDGDSIICVLDSDYSWERSEGGIANIVRYRILR